MKSIVAAFALLPCLCVADLSIGIGTAQAQEPSTAAATADKLPSFEVATIKPSKPGDQSQNLRSGGGRIEIENFTLRRLIRTAYGLKSDSQVVGGPDWMGKQPFDITGKYDDAEVARMQQMASGRERFQEARRALQALLADRFQLRCTQETRTIPVYALVALKTGAKLSPSAPQMGADGKPLDKGHGLNNTNGHLTATAVSMSSFADWFAYLPECERVVVDHTGLSGEFDFKMEWAQDYGQGVPPDATLPGLFTALREQLGLELKPDKAPVDVVVVTSAKEPEAD
jgi:uncharacterized protein (TIGR03435 family)